MIQLTVLFPSFPSVVRWRVAVGGQESPWTPLYKDGDGGGPMSSYAGPTVTSTSPAGGPTPGGFPMEVVGENFAPTSQVFIGTYVRV